MLASSDKRLNVCCAGSSVAVHNWQPDMSDDELAEKCKAEMAQWFGAEEVASWQLLRIYRIPFAQPDQVQCLYRCSLSVDLMDRYLLHLKS